MKNQKQRTYLVIAVILMTFSSLIIPNISGITIENKKIINNRVDIQTAENIANTHIMMCEKENHLIIDKIEIKNEYENRLMYVFNLHPQGYIVVTANKYLPSEPVVVVPWKTPSLYKSTSVFAWVIPSTSILPATNIFLWLSIRKPVFI